jgi:hypothetical protein
MALASPIGILLQNLWQTWVFAAVFVAVSIFSGAFIGVIIAFIVASIGSFLYRKYVNRLLPVPAKTAVLITGCSAGIGEAAALRLCRSGFLVFAGVRKVEDGEKLRTAANSSMMCPIILDVTKADHIKAAVQTVKARLAEDNRKLLGLINCGQSRTHTLTPSHVRPAPSPVLIAWCECVCVSARVCGCSGVR